MFEPNRTDWSIGKAMFDATGGKVAYRNASGFEGKTVEIQRSFFFQSSVPNQNQSTILQTNNILTRKSHDTSTD